MLWVLIAGPFWVTGFTGGPDGLLPHVVFHPVYIVLLIGAILILRRVRSEHGSRGVHRIALALLVSQAAAIVGMVGEEIAVLQHGGPSAGKEIFEEPLHLLSATLTIIPGLLLSQIVLVVLTIAMALAKRAEQRRRRGAISDTRSTIANPAINP